MMPGMIVVHHLENSRSQRVLWLLEELGLEYRVQPYRRDAKTMLAPPELRRVHPLGKSPVIEDAGLVLAESGAIVDYLAQRYGAKQRLVPSPESPDRLRYTYWLHYAEGSMMPPLLMQLVFSRLPKNPMPFFARPIVAALADKVRTTYLGPQIRLHLDYVEGELAKNEWFAGSHFSAADIQMSFPLEAAATRGGLGAQHPRIQAFLERIHARPAYQRALERGGPYALLS